VLLDAVAAAVVAADDVADGAAVAAAADVTTRTRPAGIGVGERRRVESEFATWRVYVILDITTHDLQIGSDELKYVGAK
jgi:hypothetical protein